MILVNGQVADIHTTIHSNDVIIVQESTAGEAASMELGQLPEYKKNISVQVNNKTILLPRLVKVNGELQLDSYQIKENDEIVFQDYYTEEQLAEFAGIMPEEAPVQTKKPVEEPVKPEETAEQKTEEVETAVAAEQATAQPAAKQAVPVNVTVLVNGRPIMLKGKTSYVYVDVFDYINFDLSNPQGSGIVTNLNGRPAQYMENIMDGDRIEIYWKD